MINKSTAGVLAELGGEATLLDLHEIDLPPMAVESYAVHERLPNCVNNFTDQVLAADAIVLGTPVYHATFSGLLKAPSTIYLSTPSTASP